MIFAPFTTKQNKGKQQQRECRFPTYQLLAAPVVASPHRIRDAHLMHRHPATPRTHTHHGVKNGTMFTTGCSIRRYSYFIPIHSDPFHLHVLCLVYHSSSLGYITSYWNYLASIAQPVTWWRAPCTVLQNTREGKGFHPIHSPAVKTISLSPCRNFHGMALCEKRWHRHDKNIGVAAEINCGGVRRLHHT